MAMRDIHAIKPNCPRIDKQIAVLEHGKAENDQRLIAGIQSVISGTRGVLSLVRGAPMARMSSSPLESGLEPSIASAELRRASGPARLGAAILSDKIDLMRRAFIAALCCALLPLGPASVALAVDKDTAKPDAAPLAFITVAGGPGDGEQALTAALSRRLAGAGVKTASPEATNVYSVEGTVHVMAAKGGRQSVRIDWTVFAPDGSTLGGVSQTKLVRKGSLDKKWGAAADAAAGAAADEIVKLLPH